MKAEAKEKKGSVGGLLRRRAVRVMLVLWVVVIVALVLLGIMPARKKIAMLDKKIEKASTLLRLAPQSKDLADLIKQIGSKGRDFAPRRPLAYRELQAVPGIFRELALNHNLEVIKIDPNLVSPDPASPEDEEPFLSLDLVVGGGLADFQEFLVDSFTRVPFLDTVKRIETRFGKSSLEYRANMRLAVKRERTG